MMTWQDRIREIDEIAHLRVPHAAAAASNRVEARFKILSIELRGQGLSVAQKEVISAKIEMPRSPSDLSQGRLREHPAPERPLPAR